MPAPSFRLTLIPAPLGNWFCATRLAILDLSALGHQLMQDKATGNWIVYNGEIYNFREIRRKRSFDPPTFSTAIFSAITVWIGTAEINLDVFLRRTRQVG